MSEEAKWEWMPTENGVRVVKLLSWRYYLEFTCKEMLEHEAYIYRGQRNESWSLNTTLDRLNVDKPYEYFTSMYKHLDRFKFAVRGRRGTNPEKIESANDWWALGQHHGLATPLLDWSRSPFVAAYFAFIDVGSEQDEYRAIYALHKPTIEYKVNDIHVALIMDQNDKREAYEKGVTLSTEDLLFITRTPLNREVEFVQPLSDENHRLVNQNGLFTVVNKDLTIDEWVRENFEGETSAILIKIMIPERERIECLTTLNRMNINHLTLFPDLDGACKFTNLCGEIKNY